MSLLEIFFAAGYCYCLYASMGSMLCHMRVAHHFWLVFVVIRDSLPPESDALKQSGCCMRLWSASFVSSILPEPTAN